VKIVTITRDMRPYRAGTDYPFPDDVADKLVADGDAKNPRPFPSARRPPNKRPKGTYLTKGSNQ